MGARDCILVTGGAGFVGSHFARAALEAGSRVIVLDDLSGGPMPAAPSLAAVELVVGDIGDRALVRRTIETRGVTAIAHFAGKISVGESVTNPALYFDHNLVRALALLEASRGLVERFLFSSTAAVYGEPAELPIVETTACRPINPYGATKLAFEQALAAYGAAYGLRWAALRYFNAAGAHPDGTLRESHEPETHLVPLVIDAGRGARPPLTVFGDDFDTPDGTCIRDYVHVCDLARAHLAALDALDAGVAVGATNLASGQGYSVLEVIAAAGRVLGAPVPHVIGPRRAGDPPRLYAAPERAASVLGWRTERSDLTTLIEDAARSR